VLCGDVGVQIAFLAISWHIFILTHQPFDLGLIGFTMFLPALILAIPSGMIADRFDRRLVVTIGRVVEMACAAALLLLVTMGVTALPLYLAVVAVLGSERALGRPAEKSYLRNIVDAERYLNAQATYASGREITTIGGPALGGMLIAISTNAAFTASIVLALISAVAFALLRVRRQVRAPEPQSWTTALAGLAFMRSRPVILGAITLDLFAVLFGGATALMPVYAATILHIGPAGLGYLRSAPAVGAAIVAAFAGRRASVSVSCPSCRRSASGWRRSCSVSRRTSGSRSAHSSFWAPSTWSGACCATASFSSTRPMQCVAASPPCSPCSRPPQTSWARLNPARRPR
jgi:MFS family permease